MGYRSTGHQQNPQKPKSTCNQGFQAKRKHRNLDTLCIKIAVLFWKIPMGTAAASLHMRTEDLCVPTTPPNSLQASSRKKHLPQLTLRGLSHSFFSIASAKEIPMYDIICKSAIYCCQKATKFAFSQNKLQKQINQAENQLISCLIFGPANSFEAAVQGYTQARPAVLCGTYGPSGPRCRGSAATIGWQ